MKTILSILGAVLFVLGFAMATGVDQNPVQAIYALVLMGAALVCFRRADAIDSASEKTLSDSPSMGRTADYQSAA